MVLVQRGRITPEAFESKRREGEFQRVVARRDQQHASAARVVAALRAGGSFPSGESIILHCLAFSARRIRSKRGRIGPIF